VPAAANKNAVSERYSDGSTEEPPIHLDDVPLGERVVEVPIDAFLDPFRRL